VSDVVSFPRRQPLIWICECGCSTFKVFDDQHIECAQCKATASAIGEWVKEPVPANPATPARVDRVLIASDAPQLVLRRLLKEKPEDLAVIIAMRQDGDLITFADPIEGEARVAWFDRKMAEVRRLLIGGSDAGR